MTRRIKPALRPRFQQTYPATLATANELAALGLRPGTGEPDAILEYKHGERSGICGLYECRARHQWNLPEGGFRRTNEEGDLAAAFDFFTLARYAQESNSAGSMGKPTSWPTLFPQHILTTVHTNVRVHRRRPVRRSTPHLDPVLRDVPSGAPVRPCSRIPP